MSNGKQWQTTHKDKNAKAQILLEQYVIHGTNKRSTRDHQWEGGTDTNRESRQTARVQMHTFSSMISSREIVESFAASASAKRSARVFHTVGQQRVQV